MLFDLPGPFTTSLGNNSPNTIPTKASIATRPCLVSASWYILICASFSPWLNPAGSQRPLGNNVIPGWSLTSNDDAGAAAFTVVGSASSAASN